MSSCIGMSGARKVENKLNYVVSGSFHIWHLNSSFGSRHVFSRYKSCLWRSQWFWADNLGFDMVTVVSGRTLILFLIQKSPSGLSSKHQWKGYHFLLLQCYLKYFHCDHPMTLPIPTFNISLEEKNSKPKQDQLLLVDMLLACSFSKLCASLCSILACVVSYR